MALIAMILLPLLGGCAALFAARLGRNAERWLSVLVLIAGLAALVSAIVDGGGDGRWLAISRTPWAPAMGVQLLFAMDGLSAAMLAISLGLGLIAVFVSWKTQANSGLFHAALLWTVAASNGVFLTFDLLVLAFFWELMVVPSFLLIALWGHGEREAAAMKFLIFNAVAGLGLLAAVFWMAATAPVITFDAFVLAGSGIAPAAQVWLLGGFALAFIVKLAVPPFHAWLPDAHTQAPTAGSILLAGLLLKTGAYGLFRFPPLLFPDGYLVLAPWGLALGSFGALYGAVMACGQTDAKRLVAYTSVAHMSIVLMGICGGVHFALMGAAIEMVAHAFSASALFLLIGAVYDRVGTRDLRELGGLQRTAPRFAAAFALFFAAVLAMPGTANFLGEALVITGMFQVNWVFAAIALAALVVSVVYATRLLKEIVFGEPQARPITVDLSARELALVVVLGTCTIWFGLLPQLLMVPMAPAVEAAIAAIDAAR
ncbi:complex I subunit 4 family protein [Polymorphobacter fuscus]|uniref:NADH-quinone oxidoreductase subunit M n=1 Tax=Sandarakinorhabdus fusca TaxID=1439888 RepID=A0A7C9KKB7_9SPHN|nr:NADH-quinone oxidoreductase subunit M [Polymorphobacter fuscus]KAB7643733.1 NADH-quinone oxidoreductase subunit M [Polymorphobacter fuscus]MQT18679.1 NADH-quinone oxidoreductase subunit M [Polymorphobacter fuscus]NJC08104.1 NADH-quinone oxidoreductase subunit M [Polymorphobacter fuscus]